MKSLIPAILLLLTFILMLSGPLSAEDPIGIDRYTISGTVTDATNGEELLGATIYIEELETGVATNLYGFYSVSLPEGKYTLMFSYVGFQTIQKTINLKTDLTINVELEMNKEMLTEVVIKGEMKGENLRKPEMSTFKIDSRSIKKIPAFMGEVDIIKAIQLLPGVQATSEGGSGFSVRGGSPDQNLIILDEATVYNASHLMGFFSVFNNDAIKDVTLYKGDIPASYGGRLSSLLDVRMKEGNMKKFSGSGGIGTISSRLTLEGPVVKDKISFIVSGRRTYADLFLKLSSNENLRDNALYFYDLNGKMNVKFNDNNRLFISAYSGKDIFSNDDFKMGWGTQTLSMRWNHLFSKKIFSNFTAVYSRFKYSLGVPEGQPNSFIWYAKLNDYNFKADFVYYLNPNNTITFGANTIFHQFYPGTAKGLGEEAFFSEFEVPRSNALESGIYISNEQKMGARVSLKYGLRFSLFNNIGTGVLYNFDDDYNAIDSTVFAKGEIFNTYFGVEPRMGISYSLNEVSSLKVSYARNRQYIHLASNSTAGTPLDIWFSSSPNVKPQVADQFALGYFRNFKENIIETSLEIFYKKIKNAIDFKDHAELLLNQELEGELRFGKAQSYGLELLVKLTEGRLTGWISYTLSHSERTIAEINNGKTYVSPYDKPHDISVVLNYNISKSFVFGMNWIYATGSPVTFPTGGAWYQGVRLPIYSDRNSYRLPDYHRLDFSLTYKGRQKKDRKWRGELNVSIYNVYNRKNTWVINFKPEENDPAKLYAEKTYLFGIIPAITYNFKF
ncbi:MAG: TonB-dependent receptor [Bacteroidales bacterium]|nr:TonB-dependent receptor [Bacteroidales bacterium]